MDLTKLFEMQKQLDEDIVKRKGLERKDLFLKKVIALDTEISEFVNEARFFKFWSENQEPRTEAWESPIKNGSIARTIVKTNPLLEEYVDGVHFFLSIANDCKWQESMYVPEDSINELEDTGFDGGIEGCYLEMKYWLMKIAVEKESKYSKVAELLKISHKEFCFRQAWFLYLAIGLIEFKFNPDQIEQAYFDKHAINLQRQESGY